MEKYQIFIKRSAEKELARLPAFAAKRILRTIEGLGGNPRPRNSKKLKGEKRTYRLRAGDYRIIYQVEAKERQVIVYMVRHRRDAYRN